MQTPSPLHQHLRRLAVVFGRQPVFFLTTCVQGRRRLLTQGTAAQVLLAEWRGAQERHGWAIGPYVIMPDHVHCFASPVADSRVPLATFMGGWKEWTAKGLCRTGVCETPVWQAEFFDHLLRSEESYAEKREYMRQNPVRAGLCATPVDWPFSGWIDFE
jgi:putative transposase